MTLLLGHSFVYFLFSIVVPELFVVRRLTKVLCMTQGIITYWGVTVTDFYTVTLVCVSKLFLLPVSTYEDMWAPASDMFKQMYNTSCGLLA